MSVPGTTPSSPKPISGGHAYMPSVGASPKTKALLDLNPEVLMGYKGKSNVEKLIAEHQASKEPVEILLTTESPHPLTHDLSWLAQSNPHTGYEALIKVNKLALEIGLKCKC